MKHTREGMLTNFEVAALLEAQQLARDEREAALPLPGARRGQVASTVWASQQAVTNLSEQVVGYLDKAACAGQTRESIVAFQQAAKRFKLTQMETLAMVNTPPSSVVEVHLLVEEFLKDNVAFKGDLLDILWDSRDEFIDWRPPPQVETDGPCAPRLQRSAAAAYAACLASRPA